MRLVLAIIAVLGLATPAYAQMADMPGMEQAPPDAEPTDPHAGHDMAAMPDTAEPEEAVGNQPAPPPPSDHAADALFNAGEMAMSRRMSSRKSRPRSGRSK